MSVVFIVVPLAGLIVLVAVIAFVTSARRGQFDDLDTPPIRMLYDEAPTSRVEPHWKRRASSAHERKDSLL